MAGLGHGDFTIKFLDLNQFGHNIFKVLVVPVNVRVLVLQVILVQLLTADPVSLLRSIVHCNLVGKGKGKHGGEDKPQEHNSSVHSLRGMFFRFEKNGVSLMGFLAS